MGRSRQDHGCRCQRCGPVKRTTSESATIYLSKRQVQLGAILHSRSVLQMRGYFYALKYACGDREGFSVMNGDVTYPCGYWMNNTLFIGTWYHKHAAAISVSTAVVGELIENGSKYSWNSTRFLEASNAIIDFYMAYTPGNETETRTYTTPKLLECLLYWCKDIRYFLQRRCSSRATGPQLRRTIQRPWLQSSPLHPTRTSRIPIRQAIFSS
jgi:hypothetical protein